MVSPPASPHTGAAPLTWCFLPFSGSLRSFSGRGPRAGHGPGPPGPHAASSACRNLSPAGRFLLRPPSLFPLPESAGSPHKREVSDPRSFAPVNLSQGPRITGESNSTSFCTFGPC
ncbi:hypothetical protein NDU88_007277 [Pleurodeles waltl]|uniref:Uncharacterized protein n=1 Tax=Pleurodeles waltl TaxID=8319 RepID=A0AAV7N1N0_PLEWA|nr:hypothetical protein NDU88_007277 [Pleurodeles waltl]